MRRKFNDSLSIVGPFIAILILSVALGALAQMSGAGSESSQHAVIPAQLASDAPQVLFAKAVTYSSGPGEGPFADSVAIADLNGDGKLDLAVVNGYLGTVAVLLGNGDGTFQTAVPYSTGGGFPNAVAIADVNGDGKADIVVANCGADGCQSGDEGSVSVLLGKGDGTFQAPVSYSAWVPDSVAIADVNGDGYPDLVVADYFQDGSGNSGGVSVLLNNGDGTFQPPVSYGVPGYIAVSVAVADVNNDGKPDLLVANDCLDFSCKSGSVVVLLGNGDGTFQPGTAYTSGVAATSLAVADLNGDGHPDLVVADMGVWPNTYGAVSVLLGNGDGTFQPAVTYSSGAGGAYSVAVADVNGDGKPDIVVADEGGKSYETGVVGVLLGNGDGTFQKAVLYSSGVGTTPPAWYSTSSIAIGDVNGDGRPDLVVADQCFSDCSDGGVGVLLNSFKVTTTTALTSSPNPSQVNQSVLFTATVSSARPIPDGQIVTFKNGAQRLGTGTTTNGVATLTAAFSKANTYSINASYARSGFLGASSGTVKQVVDKYTTTTTLSSSLNPSNYGQPVTLTATVTSAGPAPTGIVTFKSGSVVLGSKTLNAGGVATLTTAKIPVGTDTLTATYNGDTWNGKNVSAAITQTVSQASLSMVLTSTPNPSTFGTSVKFTAKLTSTGGLPSGQPVTFSYNNATLGTANVNDTGVATFSTTTLPPGSDVVTAAYPGSVDYSSASATVTQVVN